jgi:hypothetical protein
MTERRQTVIPNPDPSAITSEAIEKRVDNAERVIGARIDGMEKAVQVFQGDLTRVPTQLDRAVVAERNLTDAKIAQLLSEMKAINEFTETVRVGIKEVIEQRLDGMDKAIELFQKFTDRTPEYVRDQVTHLRELHEAGFESIRTQFTLLKQATEQLDLANKTAIAAALQAQKESAGETQKSSQAAIAKSETSTSEAIKALTTSFNAAIANADVRISDVKGRLDRGEGRTSVSDPETTAMLRQLADKVSLLADTHNQRAGGDRVSADNSGRMLSYVAIMIAAVAAFAAVGTMLHALH